MIDPDEAPAYRHPQVYHTMRGSMLSGGRRIIDAIPSAAPTALPAAEAAQDDAVPLFERRRYSEPND